ncbi:NAD(P)-binding protein [Coniophora puteana RWD-64-598 SS2]|uniref:NAD(P)-binding protein n=1 Tax=Coniophora puteana (strain RWD-64-598) TaxID=741705 RepID=A0A5M3N2R0_CONPW|nr:NAD(P)-binding protein [Coniophora puteana RWD-64-598 SS2]EIW85567.1 NAD(P)-binding protein [Coniophora puteana RWD-64-598 SS2]
MATTFKNFALVGGGGALGKPVLERLLAAGAAKVVVFTRPESTSTFAPNPSLSVEKVNLGDIDALAAALQKHSIEVLVSVVGHAALEGQPMLIDAAKKSGVQLFVPSEFGFPTEGITDEGFLAVKARVADYAKSQGLPSLRIYNGFFADYAFFLGSVEEKGKFLMVEPGDKEFTLTAVADISGFVAHVLINFPQTKLKDATFRIEGDRMTLRDLASLCNTVKSIPVEIVDAVPKDVALAEGKQYLIAHFNSRKGIVSWDNSQQKDLGTSAISNGLWAGHTWKSVKDVLEQ